MGVAAGKDYAAGWAQTHGGEQANSCQDCVFNLGQNPKMRRSQAVPHAHKGCWGPLDPTFEEVDGAS